MSIASEIERLNNAKNAISEAIAEKGVTVPDGTKLDGMPLLVAAIEPSLQEKTVTPSMSSQIVSPDSGYDGLSKVTVDAVVSVEQAVPTITVSSSGLITASSEQSEGFVVEGTKTATKQLTTQAAQTITPGTSNKTISSGKYLTGKQTIKGDANLLPENIKSGVSIFGVEGACEGAKTCGLKLENYHATKITFYYVCNETYYENAMAEDDVQIHKDGLPTNGYIIAVPTGGVPQYTIKNGEILYTAYKKASSVTVVIIKITAAEGEQVWIEAD